MVDEFVKEQEAISGAINPAKQPAQTITSMKDIKGW